jgi:hypothetical protein
MGWAGKEAKDRQGERKAGKDTERKQGEREPQV